jgi:hypothetical protein
MSMSGETQSPLNKARARTKRRSLLIKGNARVGDNDRF